MFSFSVQTTGGRAVDMVLLDWTRMGTTYCLAGVIRQDGLLRVIRPLPPQARTAPVRNVGWPPHLMDGHVRWEVFELLDPQPAVPPQPPHLEDVWVRGLRPRRLMAEPSLRRAVLTGTQATAGQSLFGGPLTATRAGAFLAPGAGGRSLVSVVVPGRRLAFSVSWREGAAEPDYRVSLPLPGLKERIVPVKDHFLLRQAETAADAEGRLHALEQAADQLGEEVVVRLGLSRPFAAVPGRPATACWLMADGFFSLTAPLP